MADFPESKSILHFPGKMLAAELQYPPRIMDIAAFPHAVHPCLWWILKERGFILTYPISSSHFQFPQGTLNIRFLNLK